MHKFLVCALVTVAFCGSVLAETVITEECAENEGESYYPNNTK